ncbi:hypothetical protein HHK36_003443 [Tetracentron sinense]|uniref:J domain-containing protein n=1 Tax=Tetracentron sinense TaxID=13715 RepID=A0A834ZPA7_TETSI|nr:hypothetical protein HHK36_003443 [Tetracentron sinense]
MVGTITLPTGTLIPGNRLSSVGISRSHLTMPFGGRNAPITTIRAFAQTAVRVQTKVANLYQVLRIKETASPVEIKTAYRSLAKLYHPDAASSESDGGDFIEIHNAYATLSDPTARALYDQSISAGRRFRYSAGNRPGFCGSVRWETDQCW